MKRLAVILFLAAAPAWLWAQPAPPPTKDADKPAANDEAKPEPPAKADEALQGLIAVKLMGISVMKPDTNQGQPRWWGWGGTGTSLTFSATAAKGGIIGFDYLASKLTTFRDDLGQDLGEMYRKGLLDKARGARGPQWIQGQAMGSRSLWRLMVGSPDVPAEGAIAIMFKAKVVILWAAKEKTVKLKEVELKAGTKLDFGGVKMEIVSIPEGWMMGNPAGPETTTFGLQWQQEGDIVRDIKFLRANGTELPAQQRGSSSSGDEKKTTVARFYFLSEKVDKLTVSLTYSEDIKRVEVPIDITTGVGF